MTWISALTLLVLVVHSIQAIVWLKQPQNQEVLPGARVVLPCKVEGQYKSMNWLGKTSDMPTELIYFKQLGQLPDRQVSGFAYEDEFDLVIESVSYTANNGKYRCTVKIDSDNNEVKEATVTVLQEPSAPTFSVVSGGSSVGAPFIAGNTYEIDCVTSGGNPKPRIVWTRNGEEIADTASADSLKLSRKFTKEDHDAIFECSVKNNAIADPKENQFRADVQYIPALNAAPLTGDQHLVIENSTTTLQCIVDANPTATSVEWRKKDGDVLVSSSANMSLFNVAQADAGAYVCSATNDRGTGTKDIPVNVLYSPRITLPSEETFNEGDAVSIECVVDANPKPDQNRIVWLKKKGTVATGAWLNFTAVNRKDDSFYECSASNTMKPTEGEKHDAVSEKSIKLVVNYIPGQATVKGASDVTQGNAISLNCELPDVGNPAATFKWQVKNADGVVKNLVEVSSTLKIPTSKREDEGVYVCWGINTIGEGAKGEMKVNVNVVPAIGSDWKSTIDIKENKPLSLDCIATGKPIPNILWKKDGKIIDDSRSAIFEVAESDVSAERRKSTLHFRGPGRTPTDTKIEPSDQGRYECVASNVGGEATKEADVNVLYQPRMRTNQLKFAAQVASDAELSCVAEAYPQPSFEWNRNNAKVESVGRFKIENPMKVEGEDYEYVFRSVLKISKVEESDYGAYQCVSGNDEGLSDLNVTLEKLSRPDPPTNLKFADAKYNAVTLKWQSGFNGGKEQKFYLLLKKEVARRKRVVLDQRTEIGVAKVDTPPGTPFEYNITELEPSQSYSVSLEAVNGLGGSDYAKSSFKTEPFPVSRDMVPGVENVNIEKNILTATVKNGNLSGWDLCMKVEASTTGEVEDYKSLNECGGVSDKFTIPADARKVRVSACVAERPSVCGVAVERDLSPPLPWWIWLLVALGGLLVLILLIFLICCCCRRRRRQQSSKKEEKAKMDGSPPDYDNDTAHRKRQPPYAADNPAHDIDFSDPKLQGVYANHLGGPGMPLDYPDGRYVANPVNVVDNNSGGHFPPYWPSNNGTMQRPLSSYNPYITPPHQQHHPSQHGTFRSGGGPHQNPAMMQHLSPLIMDFDDDAKKPDGYDSGYSAEDHPVAAPQRQPTQKSAGKRTIYEVVV